MAVAILGAPRSRRHLGNRRVAMPVSGAQDGLLRRPADRLGQQLGVQRARLYRLRRAVRGAALQARGLHRLGGFMPPADRHRRQAHQRTVAGAVGIGAAAQRLAGGPEGLQRAGRGSPDVEALAGHRVVALLVPPAEALDQVARVQPARSEQGICQAQRHAGVVGPLAGREAERAAAHQVGNGWLRIPPSELERRAERVPERQPDQRPLGTVQNVLRAALDWQSHSATLPRPASTDRGLWRVEWAVCVEFAISRH